MIIDFTNINGGGGGGYVLPVASQSTLGGVKVGQNLTIDSGGTLNAVGGEQDYKIVTGITDYSAGKMYGIVTNGGTYEFTGNPSTKINCGNIKTHFYGEVADTSAKYEFNPWIGSPGDGNNQIVDVYVTKEVGDTYPTLTVKYAYDNALTETLTHNLEDTGKDTYALPAHTFSDNAVFSGVNISVIFNGDNSVSVDLEGESGTTLGEMKIATNVFNWNTNVDNCSGSTISDEQRFNGISYTNGTTALPLTFIEGNSMVAIVSGSDDMHKCLRPFHLAESNGVGSANGYIGDICFWDNRLWVLRNYNGAVNCVVANFNGNTDVNETFNVVQYYGDIPGDEIIFTLNFKNWEMVRYVSLDSWNEQFIVWEDDQMQTQSFTFPRNGISSHLWGNIDIRAYDGVISFTCRQLANEITLNGTWYQVSGAHWEPIDWAYNNANPYKFVIDSGSLPLPSADRKGAAKVGSGLSIDNDGRLNVNLIANYNQGIGCSATTYGFVIDMKYINEAYTGGIGNRNLHNRDDKDYDFGMSLNANGEIEWGFVDYNQYIQLETGVVQTQGTYTVAQGQDYEATITWSGNTVEMAFTNTNWYLDEFRMPDIPILCYTGNNITYYVKQR